MAWKYCKMGYPYMVHERKSDEENKRILSDEGLKKIRDAKEALKSMSFHERMGWTELDKRESEEE